QLSDVRFLQYPNHRGRSVAINEQAMPILTQEAIQSQQAAVDIVTGATDTSEAFIQSLDSALRQAAT
ncbi:MAG TPA: FMN-binding protein, partial [Thermomicrobiales bacterium]|nr:FMN-binding protein [Thermomicrobiales bacterium]